MYWIVIVLQEFALYADEEVLMKRTKICIKCGIKKSIDGFYTAGKSKKGTVVYRGKCKECELLESKVPIEERIVPPKHITDDIVYKKMSANGVRCTR